MEVRFGLDMPRCSLVTMENGVRYLPVNDCKDGHAGARQLQEAPLGKRLRQLSSTRKKPSKNNKII